MCEVYDFRGAEAVAVGFWRCDGVRDLCRRGDCASFRSGWRLSCESGWCGGDEDVEFRPAFLPPTFIVIFLDLPCLILCFFLCELMFVLLLCATFLVGAVDFVERIRDC